MLYVTFTLHVLLARPIQKTEFGRIIGHLNLAMHSGIGTGDSGGSMNRGPQLLGPPSSLATEKF